MKRGDIQDDKGSWSVLSVFVLTLGLDRSPKASEDIHGRRGASEIIVKNRSLEFTETKRCEVVAASGYSRFGLTTFRLVLEVGPPPLDVSPRT